MNKTELLYKVFQKSQGVTTDTRDDVKNKVFFALSGENFDGNKFAKVAIDNGALLAVIDKEEYLAGEKFYLVDDVLSALQKLASHHRKIMPAKVMGITGSNGKTTTKELIASVLASEYSIISTIGNLNNHIGVPLTLLRIKKETQIAVVEMGANHIGEIAALCDIADPDVGMITNIGKAHLEGFGSYEGVIAAKSELYDYLEKHNGHAIVNTDDKLLVGLSEKLKKTTYGTNNANIEGELINQHPFLQVKWGAMGKILQCNSQLYGSYNFSNILAAMATGIYFKVDNSFINQAIESYVSENNRSQQIKTSHNKIILDAYNANPFSLKEAIISFHNSGFDNPWLIIGDMFELGEYSAAEHQEIVELLKKLDFKNVFLIGNEFSTTKDHSFTKFENTTDACNFIESNSLSGANILIKGSRGMKLEQLTKYL